MQIKFRAIPFFHYHRTDDNGKKVLVNYSRFIRGKDEEPDVVQILVPQHDKQLPKLENGARCLCRFENERFTESGQKIEEYSFGCVLPEVMTFTWDKEHTSWSYTVQIGNRTFVFCPKMQRSKVFPTNGSSAEVRWKVKPYRVDYASDCATFFILKVVLIEELTSVRAKNRQERKGHRSNEPVKS